MAEFAAFPAGSDGDGDRAWYYYGLLSILKRRSGLEAGSKITVNIRGIILKEHGIDEAQDKDPTGDVVEDYEFVRNCASSPLATPKDDDEMFGELIAVDGRLTHS